MPSWPGCATPPSRIPFAFAGTWFAGTRRIATRCEVCQSRHQRQTTMPRGDKSSYSDKQKRQAEHIEEGYEKRGLGFMRHE